MADQNVTRKLAAILYADVVGYSRLTGVDEEGTHRTVADYLDAIAAKVSSYDGRVVHYAGDAILADFPSVVTAVKCAVEVQNELAVRNADIPDDRKVQFRIGVNLGDVIVDRDDIYGNGVNVAARLEGLADPGGICVSGSVLEQVQGKVDVGFEDMGPQEVKNIAKSVQTYRVVVGQPPSRTSPPSLPKKPSIAVLPFDNMSGDPEQEYFADGVAEDVITALSKLSRMRVIARNSTFAYRGQATDIRRIAKELGVRYVVEGSVRSGGTRLRVTAQLIDAQDGSHLWAERYDRTVDDVFDIQDEITKEIVTALRVKLTDGEEARVSSRGTNDIEAWQLCVRATELYLRFNATDYLEARDLAEKAIQRDPNYAYAWAILGSTFWYDSRLGYTADSEDKLARAKECADRAMALDDTISPAITLSVHLAGITGREHEGVALARRGVELYPSNADVRGMLGFALIRVEQYRQAVDHFRAAMSLNPLYPNWYRNGLARALMLLGEFDQALALADETLGTEPGNIVSWIFKAYMFGEIGRSHDAEEAMTKLGQIAPNLRLKHVPEMLMINNTSAARHIVNALRKVDFPE